VKEHKAHWRKGEETLAKLLKEGKDIRSFAIEGEGKEENMEERGGRCELKKIGTL